MASAASRCRYRSRPSKAVQRPSGPWTRLATTRWVCSSGSPSLDVRWSNPTATSPCPATCWTPRGRGGRPGARPGRRPPRPARHDGRPAPPGPSPGHRGRRGSRRSWSAAGLHRRRARRCGHAGGPTARRWWGGGPRTWPGTRPPMLRPLSRARWRRRRTTAPGTPRGRTDTARGRWPAHGCNTPPAPPTAWQCRPPPRRSPPAFVGASERTPGALLSSEKIAGLE